MLLLWIKIKMDYQGIGKGIKQPNTQCSLPSSTTTLFEVSLRTRGLRARHPLKQRTQLLRSAQLIFVRMKHIVSAYGSPRFSLILVASCSITQDADGPTPPEQAKTSALKLLCSVLQIRFSYLFRLILS